MTLDQIETLRAIVDQGSFRAAAQVLHKSQPALTVAIQNLENEFGFEILDRSQYRPRLTPKGRLIYESALTVLMAAQKCQRHAQEIKSDQAEVSLRVAADPLVEHKFLKMISVECQAMPTPPFLVITKSLMSNGLLDLKENRVDLAFTVYGEPKSDYEAVFVQKIELVSVVSKRLLRLEGKVTRNFLRTQSQILAYDAIDQVSLDQRPVGAAFEGGPIIFVPDHFLKLQWIENDMGWGRIGRHEYQLRAKHLMLISERYCPSLTLNLSLVRWKARPLGPVGQSIWQKFLDTNDTP